MTRQRQILVTVTYNDLGCIIDTKAEPYEEPNLQQTCNNLATDTISRREAIDAMCSVCGNDCDKSKFVYNAPQDEQVIMCPEHYALTVLPSAQPEIIYCKDCKYSEHWYRDKSRCFLWHESGIDVFDDGFCNYAERRTGE